MFPAFVTFCLCVLLFFVRVRAEETYTVSMSVPDNCRQIRLSHPSTGRYVESTGGTLTLAGVAAGETVVV